MREVIHCRSTARRSSSSGALAPCLRLLAPCAGARCCSPAAIVYTVSLVMVLVVSQQDERRPVDAIVVLGAAQYNGRPSPVLRARLDHALGLYRDELAPLVVVTGGIGRGDTTSEAMVGRRYLMAHGVPAEARASRRARAAPRRPR